MDMGMGDEHMHDPGLGMDTNYAFAQDYWYIIAGTVGFLVIIRGVNAYDARQRVKACTAHNNKHPTRPRGRVDQAWATTTALVREANHPQFYIAIRGLRWTTPPSMGRIIILFCYWAVIVYMMSWKVSKHDVFYYERIGYRNAWITLAQFPLIYLLSMKLNIIGYLIGTGHERLNWLHRWVARTMLITATVHGFHFWTLWERADFVDYVLGFMPLVKYGLAAWGILLWTVLVGFLPLRRLAYEIWVAQHVISSILMIWVLRRHIPANARWLLWMAVSFLVFDRGARWFLLLWQNIRIKPNKSTCQGMKRVGHGVAVRSVGPSTTVVTIKDVHFKWKPGQHLYLWIPRLGPLEAHPYTIACAHKLKGTCCCNSIQLIVRAHKGFSKRVLDFAIKHPDADLAGFVAGPYGLPPRWDIYETMVLIGASTGASFIIPILESLAMAQGTNCVKRIHLVVAARTLLEIDYYVKRARESGAMAREKGIAVKIHVAITGRVEARDVDHLYDGSLSQSDSDAIEPAGKPTTSSCCCSPEDENIINRGNPMKKAMVEEGVESSLDFTQVYGQRPDIEALIREPVEQAWGETAVVVCGGREIVSHTRNFVSRLSDERAVHKGTGAQGIFLHVEEYCF